MMVIRRSLFNLLSKSGSNFIPNLGRQFCIRRPERYPHADRKSIPIKDPVKSGNVGLFHSNRLCHIPMRHKDCFKAMLHSTPVVDHPKQKLSKQQASDSQCFQQLNFGDQAAERATITKAVAMRRYLLNEESLSRIKPFRPIWRTPDGEALYLLQVVMESWFN
jgi:hypothetical protein